ncbi:calpain-1 catalytic subunit [Eurytemora carolleeae]|uniref:calpain-1 catalytic subunit n=1 Tax=Eurytemora carolleeae TaxID=1294199 RepID=UPI000C766982|nr:calpain-1 catalytic subunit [Eurytemora carolleeae]|eukprot:XP_023331492.1 calpain-1 catalytic subunit-like [Eurytemora affinis]
MSLAQKVEKRKSEHAIGFRIYKLSPGMEKADARFLTYNRHIAKSEQFINLREISLRVNLPEGEYVVIPSTFNRGEEGEFLLRLYFDKKWGAKSTSGVQSSVPDRPAPRVPGVPAGTPRREEGGYGGGGGGAGYSPFV